MSIAVRTAHAATLALRPKKEPNATDRHIGSRVRMRRMMLGMSQEKLGDALGLTFQQVQKYEKGSNRIGGSRMQQIAQILDVPVGFFFDGAPKSGVVTAVGARETPAAMGSDFLTTADGISIARHFPHIPDAKIRRAIVDLIELSARKARQ